MLLRGVDTNLIIALRALLEHQNVTRAAKDVGLSQSSMSHALSRLRAHFDDPLLVPVGRRLVLTDRGKALVEPVADAVARLERVFTPAEVFDPKTSRRVFRIAATDNLELYVLPRLAATLRKSAPGIDIRVCALPDDWALALQRGDVDLKLGRKSAAPDTLESEVLSTETFGCVVRHGHKTKSRPSLREYAALDHLVILELHKMDAVRRMDLDDLVEVHQGLGPIGPAEDDPVASGSPEFLQRRNSCSSPSVFDRQTGSEDGGRFQAKVADGVLPARAPVGDVGARRIGVEDLLGDEPPLDELTAPNDADATGDVAFLAVHVEASPSSR